MLDHLSPPGRKIRRTIEASFALATALIDLDQYDPAIERCEKLCWPLPRKADLLDSFWYMIGYCHFELEHHQQALQMCRKVAEATIPSPGDRRHSRSPTTNGKRSTSWGKFITVWERPRRRSPNTRASKNVLPMLPRRFKFFSRKEIALGRSHDDQTD